MKKTDRIFACVAASLSLLWPVANHAVAAEMDLGPLEPLIGTWKTEASGVDVAPGKEGSAVGKGVSAVEPFYEIRTFEAVADAVNASSQNLVAVYYKQEVFREKDDVKFHDQRGYLIYDKENQMVYNTFCIPRAACVVAEGEAAAKMTLTSAPRGVAESSFMTENATTESFSMTMDIGENTLTYSQNTQLNIYGQAFPHTDSATLKKVL
ncbi:heme-binding beta-barrel domain-containing protein [Marinobacterium marinum]|uniref:FABP family protein n=1 Tax=Marinobacterium marinum TaxID=2756129 RepID=A0A7W1WZ80_9GAMM|nr:heme-binding beta-barrel domain-containing protein [Marinobacterium marinum]MBA4502836.1 FABP family protein [Marinobacterium marinum]